MKAKQYKNSLCIWSKNLIFFLFPMFFDPPESFRGYKGKPSESTSFSTPFQSRKFSGGSRRKASKYTTGYQTIYGILLLIFLLHINGPVLAQQTENTEKKKAFSVYGSLNVGGFMYQSNGPGIRPQPYGYSLGAALNFRIYDIHIPFFASFNEQGSAFQHPFNRYGLSPQYKWIKAHLGWRSMQMSEFTLYNTTFLGAGIELNPKKFRFGFMYGQMKAPANLVSLQLDDTQFKRRTLATRIGYGTEENHFDFIFMKAKDDTNSVAHLGDSLRNLLTAHDNFVVGLKTKTSMFEKKLVWDMDVATSAFTRDLSYNPISLSEDGSLDWVNKIITPNASSNVTYAGQSSLTYRGKAYAIGVNYRRVMPEFKSLGSEYILDDLEAITLNPSFSFLQGKVHLSGSYGIQRNNLDGQRLSTNQRNISSLNLSVNPKPFYGVNFNYSNFSFQQQVLIDTLYNDSMVVNQMNHNFTVVPRWTHISTAWVNNVVLTLSYQLLDDKNDYTAESQNNTMVLGNLNYSAVSKKNGLSLNAGLNYFNFQTSMLQLSRYGFSVGASKRMLEKKLQVRGTMSYNYQNEVSGKSSIFIFNGNASYQIFKKTRVGLQFYLSAIERSDAYHEERIQLHFSQGF